MDAGWLRPSHTVPPPCSPTARRQPCGGSTAAMEPRPTSPSPARTPGPGPESKFIAAPRSPMPTSPSWTASPAPAWRGRSSTSLTKPPAARSSAPSTDPRCFVCSIWPPSMPLSAERGAAAERAFCEPSWPTTAGPVLTEEGVEERFYTLCRLAALPDPEANVWITLAEGGAYKADFLWREERLIVETDGRDAHTTRAAFERDRLRDQRLTLAGFTMVRFTWRQVTREPDRVLRTTQDLLARLARP